MLPRALACALAAALAGCASSGAADRDAELLRQQPRGWAGTSTEERREIRAFARTYVRALAACTTVRRTVDTFVGAASQAGFVSLPERIVPRPGARYRTRMRPTDFALVVLGRRPVTDGFDVVVARLDAPRIDLEPHPLRGRAGFVLLDAHVRGGVDLPRWLSQPLALYGYAERPEGGAVEIAIGASPDDPVFVIPDLLPHLAGYAQAERILDPNQLGAVAATSAGAIEPDPEETTAFAREVVSHLEARYGLGQDAFEHGELTLAPAIAPTFLGVDEGLVGAYGHSYAADAYAALHALERGVPNRTAVLIGIGGDASPDAVIPLVLGRVLTAALGESVPERTLRRALARSGALFTSSGVDAAVGGGFAVDARQDETLPHHLRRALDGFASAGARTQLVSSAHGDAIATALGHQEIDAVAVGVPIAARDAPMQVLSPLDLWSAYRAYFGFYEMEDLGLGPAGAAREADTLTVHASRP